MELGYAKNVELAFKQRFTWGWGAGGFGRFLTAQQNGMRPAAPSAPAPTPRQTDPDFSPKI